MSKGGNSLASFNYAGAGIRTALRQEPNLKIHLVMAGMVILLALIFRLTRLEWMVLILTIFWVITVELVNTALESVVDLVSPEVKPRAKIAKDVSAAAVLMAAVVAVIVGALIFGPRLTR
ncbi:MAG: diacylglycerol kinase family protein [Candidatus Chisholmbacteria bacterium]|nr:diacylglycerol kinase family protein [Candidatus Chisholmbacteria bacterium]